MNEEKHIELITGFLEGTLDERQQADLQRCLDQGLIPAQELEGLAHLNTQLGQLPVPEPSPELRIGFYEMLNAHKQQERQRASWFQPFQNLLSALREGHLLRQLAYSMVLLAVGIGLGFWLSPAKSYENQLTNLTEEVQQMRQMMMLTLLEQTSATDRLKAVSLTSDLPNADTQVVEALLKTLNSDPNVNVRLATIEALYPHASNPVVREGLIQSIARQESPLVQIALAQVMVSLQEKRSVQELRKLLRRQDLNGAVEAKVKESINVLL